MSTVIVALNDEKRKSDVFLLVGEAGVSRFRS
jgi:hypothetical protein